MASTIVEENGAPSGERFVAQPTVAAGLARFIEAHHHPFVQAVPPFVPESARPAPRATMGGVDCSARIQATYKILDGSRGNAAWRTEDHGFDALQQAARGYYAFDQDLGVVAGHPRRAIYVVLNTEELEPNEGGAVGRISADQYRWLKDVLVCAKDDEHDLVFMFGHHPLSLIKVRGVDVDVLRASDLLGDPQIVAYLYGHDHEHGLCRDAGACGKPFTRGAVSKFWEIETGSLIEHPQEGRLIRLKWIGDGVAGMAFIETVTFTERLASADTDFARVVQLARRGAERDRCIDPKYRCSPDGRVYRNDGRHTHARLFFKLP